MFYKLLNVIRIEGDKIKLPIEKGEEIDLRKADKLAKKTKKLMENTSCKKIVLSKEIKKQEQYRNLLETEGFQVIEGDWLEEILVNEIITYIIKKKNMKKDETQISILVNDISENMLENLRKIIKEYKKVNIITNHLEKFKNIEEKFEKEEGIMIVVNNNKRKSLTKSDIIINVDFPTELLNKYKIYDEAIIVNIKTKAKINKKRFNGLVINNYEISYKNDEAFDYEKSILYDKKDIYESMFYKKQPYDETIKKIKKDKVKISKLMGNKQSI